MKSLRSRNMSAIKSKDTKPEIFVRRFLHSNGLRFRLHQKDLTGKPDIVLKKYNTLIFVNGCFWHRHEKCKYATTPKTNVNFWNQKFNQNVKRDQKCHEALREFGWKVIVIWECEVKNGSFRDCLIEKIKTNI